MNVIIFEDNNIKNLQPFSINHASFELKSGTLSNLDRIVSIFGKTENYFLIVRDELKDLIQEKFPRYMVNPQKVPSGLYLNGAVIWNKENISKVNSGYAFSNSGNLVSFLSDKDISFSNINKTITKTSKVTSDIELDYISYLWDCIDKFKEVLEFDKKNIKKETIDFLDNSIHLVNQDNIFLSKTCNISPGCILDASNGPIIFNNNVHVKSGSIIEGPIFIDHDSVINNGAKLKGNILVGPKCKLGGEITDSIFLGYSNKQHDGFLGHSFIGEWVNIGANTNNSNLKNNYGKIRFHFPKYIKETNRMFLGVMVGDYTRIGISTMINTGSYFGLGANIFGSDFQDKYIKSFSWGNNDVTELHKLIETIKIIKSRRSEILKESEISFLKTLYNSIIK